MGKTSAHQITWPVPFRDGKAALLECRGKKTVALVSGDPSWFGAADTIGDWLEPKEYRVLPGASVFSLAAARLGWQLQDVRCRAHHAAAFDRLWPEIAEGRRFIVTLRDGQAVDAFANWLVARGFGATQLVVLEALGGKRERVRKTVAHSVEFDDVIHPVAVAFQVEGDGAVLTAASGRADEIFDHDGQITKQPVRALTLSALAPRPGELLWDIGAGSGSIALEWLMSAPDTRGVAFECRKDRAASIAANAEKLGLSHRLTVVTGRAPAALAEHAKPDAVFVGGGLGVDLLDWLDGSLVGGTRLVTNAVTLETQALVAEAAKERGGKLLKIDLAEAEPLGAYRSWRASRTLVQWSVTL